MRRLSRSQRRKLSGELRDISLTPLIDVALTLLVIFMIATPMIQNAIKVSLPKGQAKEDKGDSSRELIVYIDKDQKVYFNGSQVTADALIPYLQQGTAHEENKRVYVKADQAVSYGLVLELIDKIKVVGGISHVVLATQKYT